MIITSPVAFVAAVLRLEAQPRMLLFAAEPHSWTDRQGFYYNASSLRV